MFVSEPNTLAYFAKAYNMVVGVLLNVPVRTKNDLEVKVKKREKKSYFFDFLSIFSKKIEV